MLPEYIGVVVFRDGTRAFVLFLPHDAILSQLLPPLPYAYSPRFSVGSLVAQVQDIASLVCSCASFYSFSVRVLSISIPLIAPARGARELVSDAVPSFEV